MSNPQAALDGLDLATAHQPAVLTPLNEKQLELSQPLSVPESQITDVDDHDIPTEEELHTLRRVNGKIPWPAYTIALIEMFERFSYYGTTVVFTNFIQRPLPVGSTTGMPVTTKGVPGALGKGQSAAFGLTTFNQFWCYFTPLIGAYIADEFLGRYKTIHIAVFIDIIGHIILTISAIPSVISNPDGAMAAFAIGLLIMGIGTGCFKSNISPLIAEQYKETKKRVKTLKSGERVIVDPHMTVSRIFMYFYMMINVGSIVGQVSMVYAEQRIGFWLAYLLPTLVFLMGPLVLFVCRNRYVHTPPQGSVAARAFKLLFLASKGRWSVNPVRTWKNFKADDFWENVKPSTLGPNKPEWMKFDDAWVYQVRRGFKACHVFVWFPLFWLAYNQMSNNLTSQAATMERYGIPNDLINNLNPLSIIILVPILDNLVYPLIRRAKVNFSPIKRMTLGFFFAALSMLVCVIIQWQIYKQGKCGYYMNTCVDENDEQVASPINVWTQAPEYILMGIAELMASVVGLEYAFTKAPKNMRSLVMAVYLSTSAVSAALGQALVPLADDPLLIWNYGVVCVLSFVGGCLFWLSFKKLDSQNDQLDMLKDAKYDVTDPDEETVVHGNGTHEADKKTETSS